MSEYGAQLFHHFCTHPQRMWITVQSFTSMPPKLGCALFGDGFPRKMAMDRIQRVFPNMTELTLNELGMDYLKREGKQLVGAIYASIGDVHLSKIVLQSTAQDIIKESERTVLKDCANEFKSRYSSKRWRIEYNFKNERTQSIEMVKRRAVSQQRETRSKQDIDVWQSHNDGLLLPNISAFL